VILWVCLEVPRIKFLPAAAPKSFRSCLGSKGLFRLAQASLAQVLPSLSGRASSWWASASLGTSSCSSSGRGRAAAFRESVPWASEASGAFKAYQKASLAAADQLAESE